MVKIQEFKVRKFKSSKVQEFKSSRVQSSRCIGAPCSASPWPECFMLQKEKYLTTVSRPPSPVSRLPSPVSRPLFCHAELLFRWHSHHADHFQHTGLFVG